MSEPSRKKSKNRHFSGNHQRGWLWGHHAVSETLATNFWPVLEIFVSQQASVKFATLLSRKRSEGIPIEIVSPSRLEQLSRSTEHQGLVVRLGKYPYQSMDILQGLVDKSFAQATAGILRPLVVICDRIQDAFNFGAILRCCDGAGVAGVIVGVFSQAEVTPHVARSSSGAVNYTPIIQVNDLMIAAQTVQRLGITLVAADANTDTSVWNSPLSGDCALVVGSEATGVAPELLAICDQRVCIPMQGQVTSLNVAVATGILLYEIRRQQHAPSL